jgi:hypothetical protein
MTRCSEDDWRTAGASYDPHTPPARLSLPFAAVLFPLDNVLATFSSSPSSFFLFSSSSRPPTRSSHFRKTFPFRQRQAKHDCSRSGHIVEGKIPRFFLLDVFLRC